MTSDEMTPESLSESLLTPEQRQALENREKQLVARLQEITDLLKRDPVLLALGESIAAEANATTVEAAVEAATRRSEIIELVKASGAIMGADEADVEAATRRSEIIERVEELWKAHINRIKQIATRAKEEFERTRRDIVSDELWEADGELQARRKAAGLSYY